MAAEDETSSVGRRGTSGRGRKPPPNKKETNNSSNSNSKKNSEPINNTVFSSDDESSDVSIFELSTLTMYYSIVILMPF